MWTGSTVPEKWGPEETGEWGPEVFFVVRAGRIWGMMTGST